jgi:SAM-dependent methyltransferase
MLTIKKKPLFSRLEYTPKEAIALTSIQKNAVDNYRQKIEQGIYDLEEVNCLCGSEQNILISQKDRYGLSVNTYLCKKCGMMWTNPRLTQTSIEEFYNNDYRNIYVGESQAPDDFFKQQIRHGEQIYQFVASVCTSKDNLTVFEIGCGAGGILVAFKNQGWSVYGCDLGDGYLKRGRQEGLILEQGDENSLKKYGQADLIILSHVVEHFSNPLATLKSLSDLLSNEGYLYIEVPGIFKIQQSYGNVLLFLQNAHLYHFTLNTLNRLLGQAGFELIKGNETIHAVYKKTESTERIHYQNQFLPILIYLYLLEAEHNFHILSIITWFKVKFIKVIKIILGEKLTKSLKQKFKNLS